MASIFSKIISKEIPCYKIAENKEFIAFQGKNGYRYVLDTHQKNK